MTPSTAQALPNFVLVANWSHSGRKLVPFCSQTGPILNGDGDDDDHHGGDDDDHNDSPERDDDHDDDIDYDPLQDQAATAESTTPTSAAW